MNIHKIISEFQAEKQRLDDAIVALERLSAGNHQKNKRRSKIEKTSQALAETDVAHPRSQ